MKESFIHKEAALISALLGKKSGLNDRTGKGDATEGIVEAELLTPFLPLGFECNKGAVVTAEQPDNQSPVIDRIVFDKSASVPLIHDASESIFPIESVAGLVEITMRLDTTKLRKDIEKMAPVRAMRTRHYLKPSPDSKTKVEPIDKRDCLSPRSFIIGLPANSSWEASTIASSLRQIQMELGAPTHVHGLYVLGIGYFYTKPVEDDSEPMYRIGAWTGPDRLLRFADSFRRAFDRWPRLPAGWSVDWGCYVNGESSLLAE